MNRATILVGGAVAVVAVGVIVAAVVVGTGDDKAAVATGSPSATPTRGPCDAQAVAARTVPSVVTITLTAVHSGATNTGSGVVLDASGHILTNNHVVAAQGTKPVRVRFNNGSTAIARIVGRDPLADLAVLAVGGHQHTVAIRVGSSAALRVGQPVLAVGSPLGLAGTVTAGIVSALHRSVDVPIGDGQTARLVSAVQTDAAINPGNSGGALVDCTGELVGIPSAGATAPAEDGGTSSGNIGIGFAIPSDLALPIARKLLAGGSVTHSYTGLQTEAVASGSTAEPQVLVTDVDPGSPAARAGIRPDDMISRIGTAAARAPEQLDALTLSLAPGRRLTVEYVRGGSRHTVTLTVAREP
ncbi:MAG TPA: trypsin-like peptidase domain-containing protein [Jatrophihabitantaceae bacterium]|jgi:putative serine protease PepD